MDNDIAARAAPFVQRIENLDEELASEKDAFMARCRGLRDDKKLVLGEAKNAGIAVKPLKALIKRRKLERQIWALPFDFDIDESAQYNALAEAFGDTPFGDHARARAAEARAEDGDGSSLQL